MSSDDYGMESMLEVFIYETEEMLEQLDNILLESERAESITEENINSIFRLTHTIKGSAAMMSLNSISSLAHSVEDVFYILRENPAKLTMVFTSIFDLVFQASDFFKKELEGLQNGTYDEGDPSEIIKNLELQASIIKGEGDSVKSNTSLQAPVNSSSESKDKDMAKIRVFFEDDCGMENIRAHMLLTQMDPYCEKLTSVPANPETNQEFSAQIINDGLMVICKPSKSIDEIIKVIENSLNVKTYEILQNEEPQNVTEASSKERTTASTANSTNTTNKKVKNETRNNSKGVVQSLISVNQIKLDHLMDLVGEIVTAESMVASNPDLKGLRLDNLSKSIRELRKLTDELQDIVMSIRMVPLQGTFYKMDRIVRDMSKKLGKKAELIAEGGDTEVDKTINDTMVDPLMHMIRNSMDHAIESPEERIALGKPEVGQIKLSAKNTGGEIVIIIEDDGCGLDSERILAKAIKNDILTKPAETYAEKEIYNLIMLPGFSTNEDVTEYSGRGVGLDVVRKNIEQIGGNVSISSEKGKGTTFTIKIPLTLAIVDGMNISVGNSIFTVPITAIRQSFKIDDESQIIHNSDGTEMIILRGECFPVVRLKDVLSIDEGLQNLMDGIMILVDRGNSGYCIFADELIGEYQVVVKPFPSFLSKYELKNRGLSGCSVLGDGSISLILDVNSLREK